MPKGLRKILRIFWTAWSVTLQYRGDVFLWTLTEAVTPLVAFAVWFRVTSQAHTALDSRDTLTYYILSILVITATNSWVSYFLTEEILDGTLARFLTRPISVFWQYIADHINTKLLRLALPLPAAVIIFMSFPSYFSPSLYDPSRIALAVISVLLGAAVAFLADALLASMAFWIEDSHQVMGYHYLLWTISSGILIPYAFLPSAVQSILSVLPYRYIVSAPLEILVSSSATLSAAKLLAIQLAWVAGLALALHFAWQRGLKRYAIPGQ